jgi:hypothetical protein
MIHSLSQQDRKSFLRPFLCREKIAEHLRDDPGVKRLMVKPEVG